MPQETFQAEFHGTGVQAFWNTIQKLESEPDKIHAVCLMGPDGQMQQHIVEPEESAEVCQVLRELAVRFTIRSN
jgi:hypothetical protein